MVIEGALLQAAQGRIELGAIASDNSVTVNVNGQQLQLGLHHPQNENRANLALLNDTVVTTTSTNGSRGIQFSGQDITIQNTRIESSLSASGLGGNIHVNASELLVISSDNIDSTFTQGIFAETFGVGKAGDIQLQADRLRIEGEARVSATTSGPGAGGDITVSGTDRITLIGGDPPEITDGTLFTGLLTDTTGTGNAGNLTVHTQQLQIESGAQISSATFGAGDAGTLLVNATEAIKLVGSSPSDLIGSGLFVAVNASTGNGGDLILNTGQLIILDGAQVFSGTLGLGQGGNLFINAETIEVSGTSPSEINSGLFSGSDDFFLFDQGLIAGPGGNITIDTRRLTVTDGGIVAAAIIGNTQGGGNLTINASEVIKVSGIDTADTLISTGTFLVPGTGDAGNVTLNTPRLILQDQAVVTVNNLGPSKAGTLVVNADTIELSNKAELNATTAAGQGGNIQLVVNELLRLQQQSLISAEAGGTGDGGNIGISTQLLVAAGNSDITANAFEGQGGNVQITATGVLGIEFRPENTPGNDITVSSEFEEDGMVDLTTPDADAATGLVNLPSDPIDVADTVTLGCGSTAASTFIVTGRSGLPATPAGMLRQSTVITDLGARSLTSEPTQLSQPPAPVMVPPLKLLEAQGWVVNDQGQVMLVTEPATVTPQSLGNPSTCQPSMSATAN